MTEKPGVKIEEIVEEDVESVPVSRTASAPIVQEPDDDDGEGDEKSSKPSAEEDNEEEEEDSGNESDEDSDESYEEESDDDDEDDDFFGFGSGMMSMLDGFGLFGGSRKRKGAAAAAKKKSSTKARHGSGRGVYECYSSSSVLSTGADGKTRVRETTATTRRLGHGVAETQRSVRDTGTGVERLTLRRRLGTRERTVEQARGTDGAVHTRETLRGVAAGETDAFDRAFVSAAARAAGTAALADSPAAKRARVPALEDARAASLRRRGRSRRSAIAVDEEPLEVPPAEDVVVVPDDNTPPPEAPAAAPEAPPAASEP